MNETKAELKKIFLQTGMPPNERIVAMQREVLTWIGLDADFGVSCLNRMSEDFPNDKELAMKMQAFAACAQLSCQ